MQKVKILFGALLSSLVTQAFCQASLPKDPAVTQVMIVGVYHLSNPGHDLHNIQAADVLNAKGQAEVESVSKGLSRFHPTKIAVEWGASDVADRFPKYKNGTLPPSRNEVVQLGFRLARDSGTDQVFGIDADGDFPWERLSNFANAYGFKDLLTRLNSPSNTEEFQKVVDSGGLVAALRLLNTPERINTSQSFYRDLLRIGRGSDQPGADLVGSWYHRNLLICANLLQLAKPGDRVTVFFGSGHAFLLRQCVQETPGFKLVEPTSFLP